MGELLAEVFLVLGSLLTEGQGALFLGVKLFFEAANLSLKLLNITHSYYLAAGLGILRMRSSQLLSCHCDELSLVLHGLLKKVLILSFQESIFILALLEVALVL